MQPILDLQPSPSQTPSDSIKGVPGVVICEFAASCRLWTSPFPNTIGRQAAYTFLIQTQGMQWLVEHQRDVKTVLDTVEQVILAEVSPCPN
ncbi:MAG: hypothetical protein PHQ40_00280 [Anaerolineaceae bacterium]|nr:hypothetical protein [Anaerolineaceae bacterium]MDD5367492.1 hypothetical protein [Anaerolineaceae bacterium]